MLRHQLAGQTDALRNLLGREVEAFTLRKIMDVPGFDPYQAKAAGTVPPTTGTDPRA
jgi:hypothetical protein